MPLFPRLCLSRFARSVSKRGRISLQYSRTVTSLPKLRKTEANSSPMTPPPITHNLLGTSSISRISREVSIPGRSAPGIGKEAETEPVAMMIQSAEYSCSAAAPASESSAGRTVTVWASLKEAFPRTRVMFLCDRSPSTPERSCATTAFFRSITLLKSKLYDTPVTPYS